MNQYTKNIFRLLAITVLSIGITACATTRQQDTADRTEDKPAPSDRQQTLYQKLKRPIPHSIDGEIPAAYYNALQTGTRTEAGKPGPEYWQQQADYDINVELLPDEKMIVGNSSITYYNNSPDTLNNLILELAQNLHKEGSRRIRDAEITGGVELKKLQFNGDSLPEIQSFQQNRSGGYIIDATRLVVRPPSPVAPGDTVSLQTEWSFKIPQQGAGGRMGYNQDNLFFIAYWYPQIMVYDDVYGWFTDLFLGNAEFYHEFGTYDVDITVPEQWLVAATGQLQNADGVLNDSVLARYEKAGASDDIVRIAGKGDFGNLTQEGENGKLTWEFNAEDVRDFAFSVTKESIWEGARTSVGDRDGDGENEHARIGAIYRESASNWKDAAKFSQHSIEFLSNYTGLSYPWPHMTAVEGGGIIGGGMEFPMITVIGPYNWSEDSDPLYNVIAHEFAHMWVPMMVSTNERRYSWMDEGTTTFNENQSRKDYFEDSNNPDQSEFRSYLRLAGTVLEGEIMRWSDFHYPGGFGIASYPKPASMLVALRGVLGEDTFIKAYQTYLDSWKFKHPYPWDMFNIFEEVSGRDLDWFWRSWYYETWVLDQAVAEVNATDSGTSIIIEDRGEAPMPAEVLITLENGDTVTRHIDVDTWLDGAVRTEIQVNRPESVQMVEIDPDHKYPDANRSNNTWEK